MADDEPRILQPAPGDNVAVALREIEAGQVLRIGGREIAIQRTLQAGHKFAVRRIEAGESVVKYGMPIGRASAGIEAGAALGSHNLTDGGAAAAE